MASRNAKQASPSFIIKSLPDIGVGAPEGVDVDDMTVGARDNLVAGSDVGLSVGIAEMETIAATKTHVKEAYDFIFMCALPESGKEMQFLQC